MVTPVIGRCVYCRSQQPPLTLEHIIPDGLDGVEAIAEATCEACRLEIGRFETRAINSLTWLLRVALNIRGMGDKHKGAIRHKVLDDNTERPTVAVSTLDQLPITGLLPAFKQARILRGVSLDQVTEDFELVLVGDLTRRAEKIHYFDLDIRSYARMLCKIAHCYTVKHIGLDGFTPMLNSVIVNDARNWADFVGTDAQPFPKDLDKLHTLELQANENGLVMVRIQLFSSIGAPLYHVLTGRLAGSQRPRNTHG